MSIDDHRSLYKCNNSCNSKFIGEMFFLRLFQPYPAVEDNLSQMLEIGSTKDVSI